MTVAALRVGLRKVLREVHADVLPGLQTLQIGTVAEVSPITGADDLVPVDQAPIPHLVRGGHIEAKHVEVRCPAPLEFEPPNHRDFPEVPPETL